MKKHLKLLSMMLVVVIFFGVLSGCGKDDVAQDEAKDISTEKSDDVEKDADEKGDEVSSDNVELDCYLFDYLSKEGFANSVKKFEEDNPNIKIEAHETGDYDTKIAILIAGGEEIDIIAVRNPIQKLEWANAGTIIPLDELAGKHDFDFEEEFGKKVEEVMVDGKPYTMPVFDSLWLMLYNKSIFDEAGVEYPSSEKAMTWSEYRDLAKKLTMGEGPNKKYGAFHMTWPMYWYTMGSSKLGGGDKFYTEDGTASNIEDPAWAESIELAYEMQNVDKSVLPYIDVKSQKLKVPSFNTGDFGMFFTGDFALSLCRPEERDFKIGVAPLPRPDDSDEDYTYTFGVYGSLAIPETSEHKEEAFKMVMDVSKNMGEISTDTIPAVVTDETKNKICDSLEEIFESDGITAEDFENVLFNTKDWIPEKITGIAASEYEAIAEEEVEKYFVDMQDLETTIKNIKERADEAIEKALNK